MRDCDNPGAFRITYQNGHTRVGYGQDIDEKIEKLTSVDETVACIDVHHTEQLQHAIVVANKWRAEDRLA